MNNNGQNNRNLNPKSGLKKQQNFQASQRRTSTYNKKEENPKDQIFFDLK